MDKKRREVIIEVKLIPGLIFAVVFSLIVGTIFCLIFPK